jgi:hypothetical protein
MADYSIRRTDVRWRRFEKLIARIVDTLYGRKALVTYDDHIVGQHSGVSRQIDVSIRSDANTATESLVVVQCRDHDKPLDINDVGEFSAVIADVGARKGVMVAVHGFATSVHEYARKLNIDLMRLVDAENKLWSEYFGDEPVAFTQTVGIPTLVIHSIPRVSILVQTSRHSSSFEMPFAFETANLRVPDDSDAGTPAQLFGRVWESDAIEDDVKGERWIVVELAEPVFFAVDPSRTLLCRFLYRLEVTRANYFGLWKMAQLEGLGSVLDRTVATRRLVTTSFDFAQVFRGWETLSDQEADERDVTFRLFARSGAVEDGVRTPTVSVVREIGAAELSAIHCLCP